MEKNPQQGVSLVMTFLIMTVMLALTLNISILLFNEVKIILGVGDSVSSFYVADTGIEKTLYYTRKEVDPMYGTDNSFCRLCAACASQTDDCYSCYYTGTGCLGTCTNCQVNYTTWMPDSNRYFEVEASIIGGAIPLPRYMLKIDSTSHYKNSVRRIEFNYTK